MSTPTESELSQINRIEEQTRLYIYRIIVVESIGKALDEEYTDYLRHPNR